MVIVPAHPDQLSLGLLIEAAYLFDDVEVADFPVLFLPAVSLPCGGPFGNNIDPKFAVGPDFTRLTIGMLERINKRKAFHTDIGRFAPARLTTEHYRFTV